MVSWCCSLSWILGCLFQYWIFSTLLKFGYLFLSYFCTRKTDIINKKTLTCCKIPSYFGWYLAFFLCMWVWLLPKDTIALSRSNFFCKFWLLNLWKMICFFPATQFLFNSNISLVWLCFLLVIKKGANLTGICGGLV